MSFGYSVGDFVLLTQLAWQVVQNARKACGTHEELTREVTSLHLVLRRLEVEVSKPNSILSRSDDSLDRRGELAQLSGDCRRVLRVLDVILEKYSALSEEKRSVMKLWKMVRFGNGEMLDLAEIRLKISTSTSALTLFLNLLSIGSQGKVEIYMESHGDELRHMKRSLNWITASMQAKSPKSGEGSVLTAYAADDKAVWKNFRRELIKEGFSSDLLQRHMKTIKDYVTELGSRGALDDIEGNTDDMNTSSHRTSGRKDLEDPPMEALVEENATEDGQAKSKKKPEHSSESGSKPGESGQGRDDLKLEDKEDQKVDKKGMDWDTSFKANDNESDLDDIGTLQIDGHSSIVGNQPGVSNQGDRQRKDNTQTTSDHTDFGHKIWLSPGNEVDEIPTKMEAEEPDAHVLSSQTAQASGESYQTFRATDKQQVHLPPIADPDHLIRKWFLPHCKTRNSEELWAELRGQSGNLNIGYFVLVNPEIEAFYEVRTYDLVSLWNWMFETTVTHDHTYLRSHNLHSISQAPRSLSPLVDEFRRLMLRACAYRAYMQRVRFHKFVLHIPDTWLSDFDKYMWEFDSLLEYFLHPFGRGMMERSKKISLATQEETAALLDRWMDQFAESLYGLEQHDSINLVHALFEDDDYHPYGHLMPFAPVMSKVQALLVFYKRNCEYRIAVLNDEKCVCGHFYCFGSKHVETDLEQHKRADPAITKAIEELQDSNKALDNWAIEKAIANDFTGDSIGARPFSSSTASLSAILESCDDAQAKLFSARQQEDLRRREASSRGKVRARQK